MSYFQVPKAIEQCQKLGITVHLATGDGFDNAQVMALRCGILKPHENSLAFQGMEFEAQVRHTPHGPVSKMPFTSGPCEALKYSLCTFVIIIQQSKLTSLFGKVPLVVSNGCSCLVLNPMNFATLGPSNWSNLPQSLRDLLPILYDQSRKHMKTFLFINVDIGPGWERFCYKYGAI